VVQLAVTFMRNCVQRLMRRVHHCAGNLANLPHDFGLKR
jgi:hypothetical protein